jgi:hypothetical protein
MNARDELAEIIQDAGEYIAGSHAHDYVNPDKAADAILAAGYSKPRIINSREELDGLPEESVVIDYEGDVSQKRGGLWCGYETTPLNSTRLARIAGPFTVLYEPEASE